MKKAIEIFLLSIIILTVAVAIYAIDEDAKDPRKTYPIMEDSVRRKYFKDDCPCKDNRSSSLYYWTFML